MTDTINDTEPDDYTAADRELDSLFDVVDDEPELLRGMAYATIGIGAVLRILNAASHQDADNPLFVAIQSALLEIGVLNARPMTEAERADYGETDPDAGMTETRSDIVEAMQAVAEAVGLSDDETDEVAA